MIRIALGLCIYCLCIPVHAFDVDGFRAGDSPEKVAAQIERLGLRQDPLDGGGVLAVGKGNRLYSLNFCKGELISVQKHLNPTFSNFVEISHQFTSSHGTPSAFWPRLPDRTSYGPNHALAVRWGVGSEIVTVTFREYESNNQLDVTYEAPNSCYEVAKYLPFER